MEATAEQLSIRRAQREHLIALARNYAWWLGNRSRQVRRLQHILGWRFSRIAYRWLRRPQGALAWPLGLAMLSLNAAPEIAAADLPWVEACFAGLIGPRGESLLPPAAVDQGGIGYAALRLYELHGDEHRLRFARNLAHALVQQPGAGAGLIPYTVGRNEVLLDTVGMICPFLARLARIAGDTSYRDIALAQLEAMWRHGGAEQGWAHHAFDTCTRAPRGMRGWGRGIGWLLLGIVDTLRELPPGPQFDHWQRRCERLLTDLQACQRGNGHWPWRLDEANAHPDSSVTAFVAYCLARRIRPPGEHSFEAMEVRSHSALLDATDRRGRIGSCSGEAGGIGSYSPVFGQFLWAQGSAVAAGRIRESGTTPSGVPSLRVREDR